MKLTLNIFLLLVPVLALAQMPGQRSVPNYLIGEKNQNAAKSPSNTFHFCDTDSDGLMPIDLESIQNQVLDDNVNQFGTQEGIYISTRQAKVHLVTNMDNTPQCQFICNGSAGVGGYGMLDIAINQEGDMYVAVNDKIYKLNNTNCSVQNTIDLGLNGSSVTSLSFDRNHNIYLGGFDSRVYRLLNGAYGTMNQWHDFGQGAAAGDFVMCGDKMYIAWAINGGCRLYEVTVDSNTDYVSHTDLGSLPDNTFGLASELGKLYGVTPFQLYKIDFGPLAFTPVLNNPNPMDDWFGAAGKNEAVSFEIKVFETAQNALNNVNPLPAQWTNTVPFGQTVYVVIRNILNNQTVTVPVQLVIQAAPAYNNPMQIVHCENEPNANVFDLGAERAAIIGAQPNVVLTYHTNNVQAQDNINPLPDSYTVSGNTATVSVRLTNSVTNCFSVFQFALEVAPKPDFNQPKDMVICTVNTGAVQLDNQIPQILNGQDTEDIGITFHDTMNDAEDGVNDLPVPYPMMSGVKEIFVRIENTYSGCFDTGSFFVKALSENNNSPVYYSVETDDWSYDNNSIQVLANGNYEYSLDGIKYQDTPYFAGLPMGKYELHVRDKDNCSVSVKEVFLLMYPKYFTPNGDGYHDRWNIILGSAEPDMEIEIYDRYGKVINGFSGKSAGWDGTLNGKELPSSDYWFTVKRQSGKEFKGHFTLKR